MTGLLAALALLAPLTGAGAVGAHLGRTGPSVVYEGRSAFQRLIVRDRPDGVRELLFAPDGAIQSAIRLDRPDQLVLPYTRTMMAALAVVPRPRRILMIGLGGGTMARFLLVALPRATLDAVELDPAVVDLARRYFELPDDPRLRVHVADGRAFVERVDRRWDLILLDAYSDEGVPFALATREFLAAVRERTEPGGVVAANVWSESRNPLYGSMLATFVEVFDQLLVVASPGGSNRILLALPRAVEDPARTLARRSERLDSPAVRALRLPDLLRSELVVDVRVPAGATVLRDAAGDQ